MSKTTRLGGEYDMASFCPGATASRVRRIRIDGEDGPNNHMLIITLALALVALAVASRDTSLRSLNAKRHQAVERWELSARGAGTNARRAPTVKNITFSNPKASRE